MIFHFLSLLLSILYNYTLTNDKQQQQKIATLETLIRSLSFTRSIVALFCHLIDFRFQFKWRINLASLEPMLALIYMSECMFWINQHFLCVFNLRFVFISFHLHHFILKAFGAVYSRRRGKKLILKEKPFSYFFLVLFASVSDFGIEYPCVCSFRLTF